MSEETSILKKGSPVLLVLHSPREKCWGMLDEVTSAGVFLRGLDERLTIGLARLFTMAVYRLGSMFSRCGELNDRQG